MASATLQINVIPKRMLTAGEGAHHCGRSLTRFKIDFPSSQLLIRMAISGTMFKTSMSGSQPESWRRRPRCRRHLGETVGA